MPKTAAHKTLLIFRKDVRHLWPEIALTLALTIACAATDHQLQPGAPPIDGMTEMLLSALRWLLPLAWCVLIARDVHDESLVGDMQFWLTRPCGWPTVLAAKLLMVANFVLLPCLLGQMFVLHQAALPVFTVLPLLALKMLLFLCFLLLPLLALSAVTPSLTRMILYLIGFFVYVCLVAYLLTLAHRHDDIAWQPSIIHPIWALLLWVIPVFTAVTVLLQYAKRRTGISLGVLIGLVAVLTLLLVGSTSIPYKDNGYIAVTTSEAGPFRIAYNPEPTQQVPQSLAPGMQAVSPSGPPFAATTNISLPLLLSGVAPSHAVRLDARRLSTGGSMPWSSNWQPLGQIFVADSAHPEIQTRQLLQIPPASLPNAGRGLHLRYAVTEFAAEPAQTVTFTGGALDLPRSGHCDKHFLCSYALRNPPLTRITWAEHGCSTQSSPNGQKHLAEIWFGNGEAVLPNTVISPIVPTAIFDPDGKAMGRSTPMPCPGDVLTFNSWRIVQHYKVDFDLAPFDPNAYIVPNSASRQ